LNGEVDEEAADSGRFTAAGRRAALDAALPLIATYFADAATWDLEISSQVDSTIPQDSALDDLTAAVRLRASLAAADRLLRIISQVAARPTFRYIQTSAESVGVIRGRLDVGRYIREQGRISVPRRYPVRLVEQENATPENVLAAYAAAWLRRDLDAAPKHLLPLKSPEARELRQYQELLDRLLGIPLLAGTKPRAYNVWRRSNLDQLLDEVDRRLEAGHVASPVPYQELFDWMTATRQGDPVAEIGDREWSFYGAQFDTKLFEIWCLKQLADAITKLIGQPANTQPSLARRGQAPIYSWSIGAGSLNLHFQPSLSTLTSEGVVWQYAGGTRQLHGFPDLAVTSETITGQGLALFDPKLRQRTGAPTEEIYKLLGYFANLHYEKARIGAILYYSPGVPTDYKLVDGADGEIHAIGLDPETDPKSPYAVAAGLALRSAGLGDSAIELLAQPSPRDPAELAEHTASIRQAVAVDAMQQAAALLPQATTLDPIRRLTAGTLRAVWPRLSEQTRTMIVTAEYFGSAAPEGADHSGPLLGLAASVERLLHEQIFDRAAAMFPAQIRSGQTLGSCLHHLNNALRGAADPEARAVAHAISQQPNIDRQKLRNLLPDARAMNRRYRIPAAHAEVIDSDTWADGRQMILESRQGLLVRLVDALLPDGQA
jgi:hypothetical protein